MAFNSLMCNEILLLVASTTLFDLILRMHNELYNLFGWGNISFLFSFCLILLIYSFVEQNYSLVLDSFA
jgi:hypothetical protein